MKVFIFGITGKVGEAILKILNYETDYQIFGHLRKKLSSDSLLLDRVFDFDLTNKVELKKHLMDIGPDIIINCMAQTNVDRCETEKKEAWDLNTTFVENIGEIAKKLNSHLITFSTDYVFDGEKGPYLESDMPNPLSYYGKTKLAAENYCLGNLEKYTIIRTNVVYGFSSFGKSDFIKWVLDKLLKSEPMEIIDGQWCNPTLSDDIASGVLKIIEQKPIGIYHIAGKDFFNRYEIAMKIAEVYKLNKSLISKIPSSQLSQLAKRPEHGGLITLKAESELGLHLSTLESGLINIKLKQKYKNY